MDELQLEKAMVIGLSLGGGVAIGFTLQFPENVTALGIVGSNGISKKWNWHFITYHFYVRTPLNHLSLIMMRRRIFSTFILKIGLIYKPENITNQMIDDIYEETQTSDFGKAFKSLQRSEYMGRKGLRSYNGDRMSEIQVPTLIVHGAHDRTIPVANARKAHELIANSELYVMEEARHWPQKEYPEEFTQIVKGFLSKNDL
jgi:pimeloyl-ACP methyl ester carboxylesterase